MTVSFRSIDNTDYCKDILEIVDQNITQIMRMVIVILSTPNTSILITVTSVWLAVCKCGENIQNFKVPKYDFSF